MGRTYKARRKWLRQNIDQNLSLLPDLMDPAKLLLRRNSKIQFRLTNGKLAKMYVSEVPEWAQIILLEDTQA